MATTAPRMRQYEHVQRRIELKPSLSVASKRTAPQWHWPARTFVSSTMLPVSPVQMASSPVFAEFVARMSACDMREQRSPGSRSLSSGAHSRDPLARPGYGASRAPAKKFWWSCRDAGCSNVLWPRTNRHRRPVRLKERPMNKNTICLWYNHDAEEAARSYAKTFPNSSVDSIHRAPSDFPGGKAGQVLTVQFTVCGVPCIGLNGGDMFKQSEAFSFQIATDTQEETDRYWNAIVSNGGEQKWCGWCKDRWGIFWQITPRVLTDAMAAGGDEAKGVFTAMMEMDKIDIAKIEAARRG